MRLLHRTALIGLIAAMITVLFVGSNPGSARADAEGYVCREDGGLPISVPWVDLAQFTGDCLYVDIMGDGLTIDFAPSLFNTEAGFTSGEGLCHARMDLLFYDRNWHRYKTFYGDEHTNCQRGATETWEHQIPDHFQARPGWVCVKLLEGTTAVGGELKKCFGVHD